MKVTSIEWRGAQKGKKKKKKKAPTAAETDSDCSRAFKKNTKKLILIQAKNVINS